MTERSKGLPSPSQVTELLAGEFARAGYEIEDVTIAEALRPPRIAVVVDGDNPLDLDAIAELARVASELLDTVPGGDGEYVLEVTSPGVERPLTEEKHFLRNRARLVELELTDGSKFTGRVAGLTDGVLRLVVRGPKPHQRSVREVPFADITKAVVQVEFSPPSPHELELTTEAGA
ncbi:ribosome maturation factor RimP [soil metagenome]